MIAFMGHDSGPKHILTKVFQSLGKSNILRLKVIKILSVRVIVRDEIPRLFKSIMELLTNQ